MLNQLETYVAEQKYEVALQLVDSIEFEQLENSLKIKFLIGKGKSLHYTGKYNEAIATAKLGIRYLSDLKIGLRSELWMIIIPSYLYQSDIESAFQYLDSISIYSNEILDFDPNIMISLLKNKAAAYSISGDQRESIKYSDEAIKIHSKYNLNNDGLLGDIYLNKAMSYYDATHLDSAILTLNLAHQSYKKVYPSNHRKFGTIYLNTGSIEKKRGNFQKSQDAYEKTTKIWKEAYGENHYRIAALNINTADNAMQMGEYERVIRKAKNALYIIEKSSADLPNYKISILSLLTKSHLYLNNINESRKYGDQCFELAKSHFGNDHKFTFRAINNLFLIAKEMDDYTKIIELADIILESNTVNSLSSFEEINGAYSNKIYALDKLGHHDQAQLIMIHYEIHVNSRNTVSYNRQLELEKLGRKAQYNLGDPLKEINILYKAYNQERIKNYEALTLLKQYQFTYLDNLYSASQDEKLIEGIKEVSDEFLDISKEYFNYLTTPESRIVASNNIRLFINEALKPFYSAYKNGSDIVGGDDIFTLMQVGKSVLYKQRLKQNQILASNDINLSLVNNWRRTESEILELKSHITPSTDNELSRSVELNALYTKRDSLLKRVKADYPKYYDLLYENETISIEKVKQNLKDDQGMISFYLSDSKIYTILISSQETIIEIIPDLPNFLLETKRYLTLLNDYNSTFEELKLAKINSLLAPIFENAVKLNLEKLIVIPDGILSLLPFESLMLKNEMLLNTFDIHYHWSEDLRFNSSQSKIENILAIAPEYYYEGELPPLFAEVTRAGELPLKGAIEEVKTIENLLGAKVLIGTEANEQQFKKLSKSSDLIHLSMHGYLNNNNPLSSSLIFTPNVDTIEDGILNVYEIYNLELNAQLITLSSCNTANGRIEESEGVMSVSRAFAYAGVPSTLMALWEIPDKSTSEIVTSFYSYLKEGIPKSEALNKAKKQYISNAVTAKQKHPYYWAGLVLTGDNSPLDFRSNSPLSKWLLGGLCLLLITFIFFMQFQNLKSNHKKIN